MKNIRLKIILINCCILASMLMGLENSFAQCIPIQLKTGQACLSSSEVKESNLRSMKKSVSSSPEKLFYNYFRGTDYPSYKDLFLPADWYNLTIPEFEKWRSFLKNADLKRMATFYLSSGNVSLSIIKYSYVMNDQEIFETFLAKKINEEWRPVSAQEEQQYISLTNLIKYTNSSYLNSLTTEGRSAKSSDGFAMVNGMIEYDSMLQLKESLKLNQPEEYASHFNEDFVYRTNEKFNEDRGHDGAFLQYLTEMKIDAAQQDKVMALIRSQDYLNAARLADTYSEVSYTYGPFLEKIREIYGHDRIKIWDQTTQKWN